MYLPIADYAVIGDCHTAALVSSTGSIDWACLPHFNSPAVFLRLLDDSKGGYCSIKVENARSCSRQYRKNTNVLETTWHSPSGKLLVTDFMPLRRLQDERQPGQGCPKLPAYCATDPMHERRGGLRTGIDADT